MSRLCVSSTADGDDTTAQQLRDMTLIAANGFRDYTIEEVRGTGGVGRCMDA